MYLLGYSSLSINTYREIGLVKPVDSFSGSFPITIQNVG